MLQTRATTASVEWKGTVGIAPLEPDDLTLVIAPLLDNALEYTPEEGRVEVEAPEDGSTSSRACRIRGLDSPSTTAFISSIDSPERVLRRITRTGAGGGSQL